MGCTLCDLLENDIHVLLVMGGSACKFMHLGRKESFVTNLHWFDRNEGKVKKRGQESVIFVEYLLIFLDVWVITIRKCQCL